MLRIPCPWCGPRDEREFRYGGESHVQRPETGPEVTDEIWGNYLHGRRNTKGPHGERWVHTFGCGQWFNMNRDTRTHEIVVTYPLSARPPAARATRTATS